MDAMRSMFLVPVMFLFCLSACGAAPVKSSPPVDILGQLELSEVAYSNAQGEAQGAVNKSKVAQREADAAEVARTKAAQALAGNLEQAAQVRESQARGYKERMCKIDPARCAEVPARDSPSASSVQYMDLKITAFADGGFNRFGNYPDGWKLKFSASKFVLVIDGQDKAELSDPSVVGNCYRATVGGFSPISCPL